MRFQRIIQVVQAEPWLIKPAAHAAIQQLLDHKLAGVALDMKDMLPPEDCEMMVDGGVARIPIVGVIGKGLSKMEKSCGACGIEDIQDNLARALDDEGATHIMLDIDSPGGAVSGVPELGAAIAAAAGRKPVMAYTDGQMDSAAYWLAAGATAIYASPSAEVGSIGVYMPWMDSTAAYAAAGLRVEVIKNTGATYKGMGMPGTSLTPEQRDHLQERVDDIFGMFAAHVLATRKRVPADAMRGQTFMGDKAAGVGLVDSVATWETALSDLRGLKVG